MVNQEVNHVSYLKTNSHLRYYKKQKTTSQRNRLAVLTALASPSPVHHFNDLKDQVPMSPPVFSRYLKEGMESSLVREVGTGYQITESGYSYLRTNWKKSPDLPMVLFRSAESSPLQDSAKPYALQAKIDGEIGSESFYSIVTRDVSALASMGKGKVFIEFG